MERMYKLLIVDDEPEICQVYGEHFRKRGFAVETAPDGVAGLEKLHQEQFDVALIDIQMPKMNGLELVRQIQAEDMDTSLVMLTGHGERDEAVMALNLGVAAWFDKKSIDMKALSQKAYDLAQVVPPELMRKWLSAISD